MNEYTVVDTCVEQLEAVIQREEKLDHMDRDLTPSMFACLEEAVALLRNELDFDPTPQYLWDDSGGEPPVTMDEMHTAAYNRKYNS